MTGPFTVAAVPAAAFGRPEVRGIEPIDWEDQKRLPGMESGDFLQPDPSVARSGETLRQSKWRAELLKKGRIAGSRTIWGATGNESILAAAPRNQWFIYFMLRRSMNKRRRVVYQSKNERSKEIFL